MELRSYSRQYRCPYVIVEILPADADKIIEEARDEGAIYWEGDDETFVVQFPGRPVELYTERALRASVKA